MQRKLPDPFPLALLRNGVWPRETRVDPGLSKKGGSAGYMVIEHAYRCMGGVLEF